METIFKKFFKELKKEGLALPEKSSLRENVLAYAKEHPAKNNAVLHAPLFWLPIFRPIPIVALIFVLLAGTGITMAAENSLPGDILHPVKVKLNENVRGALALSPEQKAEWEIKRISRRFQEIEKLVAKGKLRTALVEKAEINLDSHLSKTSEIVSNLKEKERQETAANIQSSLETVLLVHNDILEKIDEKIVRTEKTEQEKENKNEKAELDGFRQRVKAETKDAVEQRIKTEEEIKTSSNNENTEKNFKAVENKITEVKRFVEEKKDQVKGEVFAEAQSLLESAEETMAEGKNKIEPDKNEAFTLFQKAMRLAQAAKELVAVSSQNKGINIINRNEPLRFREKIKSPRSEENEENRGNDEEDDENRSGENSGRD